MSDRSVDAEQVRREQEAEVDPRVQWAYLGLVLVGGFTTMLAFIACLAAST
jgi:hypothetical protein